MLALLLLGASAPWGWAELPFRARVTEVRSPPRELLQRGYPDAPWTVVELESTAPNLKAKWRVALTAASGRNLGEVELALLPALDAHASKLFGFFAGQLGERSDGPLLPRRAVSCLATREVGRPTRLNGASGGLPPLAPDAGESPWVTFTCDKGAGPSLAFSLNRREGQAALAVARAGLKRIASATVGAADGEPYVGAALSGWKRLPVPPGAPVMVWQRRALHLDGRRLVVTSLETAELTEVALPAEGVDVACASLQPLSCAVAISVGTDAAPALVWVDGRKVQLIDGFERGRPTGLEMRADREFLAYAVSTASGMVVGVWSRKHGSWSLQHEVPAKKLIHLGPWSDEPPGLVATFEQWEGMAGQQSVLLSLNWSRTERIPPRGPTWDSPLGRRLEVRNGAAWLFQQGEQSRVEVERLGWAGEVPTPAAWLDERWVLAGGGQVRALDTAERRAWDLLDPALHWGAVFPNGDDPSWLVVVRPEATYAARLKLP